MRVASEDRASLELFLGDGALTASEKTGVDMTSPVYLFAAPDGSFGACAKVTDDDDVEDMLDPMVVSIPSYYKSCSYSLHGVPNSRTQ